MVRLFQRLAVALGAVAVVQSALAFSMLGPYEDWQTPALGYNPLGTDIGGPMNLGEEYRWNVKTITFGFDESFKNYFGQRGVEEVRKAVAILNALPPMSKMSSDLSEFPLDSRRMNYQASALFLQDVKSSALSLLLEEMGLASPERYVWCLRDQRDIGDVTYYTVFRRNFDPVTWAPSSYVNGTLYTYGVYEFTDPTFTDAVEFPVDPLAFTYTAVVSDADGFWGGFLNYGEFFTGLTRDDVGGLRYLYRSSNYNIESLLTNVTASALSGPWSLPGGGDTNLNQAVNVALRPGIEKITFLETKYDSQLGSFITLTNQFTDTYITNSRAVSQKAQRILDQPDILFSAEDLGLYGNTGSPIALRRTVTDGWANNDALNGQALLAGPGVIQPQVTITFSKVGPFMRNNEFFIFEADGGQGFVWGSFDGTTNAPIVYPTGTSIVELERQVLGR